MLAKDQGISPWVSPWALDSDSLAVPKILFKKGIGWLGRSRAQAQKLATSLVALRHVESSQARDRTHVPSTGRQILNQWTSRESPIRVCFKYSMKTT